MEQLTLGDVCQKASSGIAQKDLEMNEGKYPVYGASGYIKDVDFYHQDQDYIAVVKDGAGIGRTMLLPAYSSVIGTMQYILPKKGSKINIKYLYYAIMYMNLSKYFSGATIPHIYFKDYKNEPIRLPELAEQQRISNIFEKIDVLIEAKKSQMEKLEKLVKSRFIEMFGDMADPRCQYLKYKLVEVCITSEDIKCGPFGTQLNKNEYQMEGVAVWEISQINSKFAEKPVHFLTVEKAEQLKAYSIEPGDIAMSRKGNVGKCALFPLNYKKGIIHSDVIRIRVDSSRVNPCFLMYQLHYSGAVQRQIEIVSTGAIMAGINVSKLKQIEIHVPNLEIQEQFAFFAEQTDKSKLAIQKSLENLEILKKSLMQRYFG